MGKNNKHIKHLKSEKGKLKLKTKKDKTLPKGQNVTDTSFKVKKIQLREQLKQQVDEIVSKRNLNVKELLMRVQHHNSTVRQEAIRELKEIIFVYNQQIMGTQIGELLKGICALTIDKEGGIRKDALKVLTTMLSTMSSEQLGPFCNILLSYLRCAMTHIDPNIQADSLLFLDVLIDNCNGILDQNHHSTLLQDFLQMISSLRILGKPERQLTTTMNSKNTSVQWRIKVYQRLTKVFKYSLGRYKSEESHGIPFRQIMQADNISRVPLYRDNDYKLPVINLYNATIQIDRQPKPILLYQSQLMPLLFESWREVCPRRKSQNALETVLGNEGIDMLKVVSNLIQLFIEAHDTEEENFHNSQWIHEYFEIFLPTFPYYTMKLSEMKPNAFISTDKCIELNLIISQIYLWIISHLNKMDVAHRKHCNSVIEYINDTLDNWTSNDNPVLPQLMKTLNTLFFKSSEILNKNRIDLQNTLRLMVDVCSRHKSIKELQSNLFTVLTDIISDRHLTFLHKEKSFEQLFKYLPRLLLKPSVHETTIKMMNKIALRYKYWLAKELFKHREGIIENANKIKIIGSEDEKSSKLSICNVFYFLDGQIYY